MSATQGTPAVAIPAQPTLPLAAPPTWIFATSRPLGFWCSACDARLLVSLPVHGNDYLSDARIFQTAHWVCRAGKVVQGG